MKKVFTICLTLGLYANIFAQIPNNSFENWTTDGGGNLNPDFWLSPNNLAGGYTPILQATGYAGTYAMRVYTPTVFAQNVPSAILLQFPSTLRPVSLNGYFKGSFAANDSSFISITSTENTNGIAAGVKYFSTNQASFAWFSIPLNYVSINNPDTISIIVSSGTNLPTPGADITIDELAFSMTAGIEIPVSSALITGGYMDASHLVFSFYINSFNTNMYTVKLFDVVGHEVYTSLNNLDEGKHLMNIPAESLVAGVYILRVIGGQTNYAQKIMIHH